MSSGPQASCQPHSGSLGNRFTGGRIRSHASESQESPYWPQAYIQAGRFCQGKCSPHLSTAPAPSEVGLPLNPFLRFADHKQKGSSCKSTHRHQDFGRMAACAGECGPTSVICSVVRALIRQEARSPNFSPSEGVEKNQSELYLLCF